uniref:B-cell receptor CD22 n=1 Tax=Esox lucius TaxID=8010 RepID=A0AAY5K0G6_ESOLU
MGSTVEMSCSYTFPSGTVTSTFWFIKYDANWKPVSLIEDPDYKDRVIYHSDDENGHKVTIKDLRKSDSAVYMFRFITDGDKYTGSPGISLSVTDGPKNTSVSVIPSGEIVEGSSVTLTCSSDANPPVDKYTWYKKTVTSPKASGQSYSITNIRPEDSGEYYCEAENGVGSNNSTALMIITGKQTSVLTASVGITVVVLVLILFGFVWFRKKASKFTAGDGQEGDYVNVNISNKTMAPTAQQTANTTDNGEEGDYVNVNISNKTMAPSAEQTAKTTDNGEEGDYVNVNISNKTMAPSAEQTAKTTDNGEEESVYANVSNMAMTPSAKDRRRQKEDPSNFYKPRTKRT